MNRLNILTKATGDRLEASEFNSLVNKVNEIVDTENNGGTPVVIDPSGILSTSAKGNVTLGSTKNINIEPAYNQGIFGDIALKPGDDIQFCSHHREAGKLDKVTIKNIDGDDNPVKLEVHAGEMSLCTKGKGLTLKEGENIEDSNPKKMFDDDPKILNLNIITGATLINDETGKKRDERGYLKVRAQAIDLRCEKHGGIALLPKGYDSDGNMNKIKFEHGGGDGLEFGTFNTQKTSLFTDEYRFKKDGIWKMAIRETEASGKTILDEREGGLLGLAATGAYKYKKNNSTNNLSKSLADSKIYEPADDFYDFVDTEDAQTTTEAIIKSAAALNNEFIETSLSSKKNLKISASNNYKIIAYDGEPSGNELTFTVDKTQIYTKDELKLILSNNNNKLSDLIDTKLPFLIDGDNGIYRLSGNITPKISIEAEEEVDIDAKYGDVVLTSGDTIKMEAPEIRLNAMNPDKSGGTVNFGSTAEVLFLEKKFTKSGNVEAPAAPTEIKLATYNNSWKTIYWDNNVSKFRRQADVLYTDVANNILYDPTNHIQDTPIYFSNGTKVPADTTCFVRYNNNGVINIYKVGTKGSSAVLSKSNDLIASISEGVYERKEKKEGVYYCPDLIIEESNWIPEAGLVEVLPEGFVLSTSCLVEDIVKLANWAKTNNKGPWDSNNL